jgi:mannitol-1-phosphate/altronate dehydrogenase
VEGELLTDDFLPCTERKALDYCNSQELFLCYFEGFNVDFCCCSTDRLTTTPLIQTAACENQFFFHDAQGVVIGTFFPVSGSASSCC